MGQSNNSQYTLDDLLYLMARLRHPNDGCPWDLKQNYLSITPSTIEEVYEVVDAIDRQDYPHLKEELGDLLFQVIFYAQLANEDGHFTFNDIVSELVAKLIRRHPHVFPEGTLQSRRGDEVLDEKQVKASWETIKASERTDKGKHGILADVPNSLPAAIRAHKLQKRAAKVGFDWAQAADILPIIQGELQELREADEIGGEDDVAEELGDVLFSCINYARKRGLDVETVLRQANDKFTRRFHYIESQMTAHKLSWDDTALDQLEEFWQQSKTVHKRNSGS